MKLEDARSYSAIGCVEVAVPGKWGYRCTGMSFSNSHFINGEGFQPEIFQKLTGRFFRDNPLLQILFVKRSQIL